MIEANMRFSDISKLYRSRKFDEAAEELRKVIQAEPTLSKAYTMLGSIYESQKKIDEAMEVYQNALSVNIDDPRANYRLGVLFMRQGNYIEGLTALRMAWSNDQTNPHVACALAFALDKTHDYATAQIMYEAALQLDPKAGMPRFNLGKLHYYQRQYESAIECFVDYLSQVENSSRVHRNIGKSLLQLGRLEDALISFQNALALEGSVANYYNVGLLQEMLGDDDSAVTNYRYALELDPGHVEARYKLGKYLRRVFREDEAIAELQRVLYYDPTHVQALNCLATCMLNREAYGEAIRLLQQAISIYPDYADAHHNLSEAYTAIGNHDLRFRHPATGGQGLWYDFLSPHKARAPRCDFRA
jgi:tetratricopeptide (TPR) repeat protein